MLYYILVGYGDNFIARCMLIVVLHTGLPNLVVYCVLRHVSNDVGLKCLVFILVHYILYHHGDICSDDGVVCRHVHGSIGRNIFDDFAANKQCR